MRAIRYSDTAAELFWQPSWDDGRVVGYEVYRDGRLVATRDATSWYDGALESGARHEYAVLALDDDGRRSGAATAVLAAPEPPRERIAAVASGGGLGPWALVALAIGALTGAGTRRTGRCRNHPETSARGVPGAP